MKLIHLSWALLAAPLLGQEPIVGTLTEQIDVTVVNVEVFARDKAGSPVTDLSPGDLRVFDNNEPVDITSFSRIDRGGSERAFGTVAVFIDEMHLTERERAQTLEWLAPLVLGEMEQKGLRGMVVGFGDELHLYQSRTRSRKRIEAAFARAAGARLHPPPSDRAASARDAHARLLETFGDVRAMVKGASQAHGAGSELTTIAAQLRRDTVLVAGGLQRVLDALALSSERTALLVVSRGFALQPLDLLMRDLQRRSAGAKTESGDLTRPTNSDEARGLDVFATLDHYDPATVSRARSRTETLSASLTELSAAPLIEQIIATANSSRVSVLPVRVGRDGTATAGARGVTDNGAALLALSQGTGGRWVASADELTEILRNDHGDAAAYLLGYAVGEIDEDSMHEVRIRARRRGIKLEHRQSYIARSLSERLAARTAATLFLGDGDNGHDLAIDGVRAVQAGDGGRNELQVTVSLPIDSLELVGDGRSLAGRVRFTAWMHTSDDRVHGPQSVIAPVAIPADEIEGARGQSFAVTFGFNVPLGEHRIAVGLWDETAARGSFIRSQLTVQ